MKISENQLKDFHQKGFLILRDLFTQDEMREALYRVDKIYEELIRPSKKETFIENGARIVFQNKNLHRIVWCGALDSIFLNIGKDPRILNPVSQILDNSNELVQLINQLHFKLPKDGVAFDYHQDAQHRSYGTKYWNDVLGNGSFIQTALALEPMTQDNGPLEFFESSHELGFLGGYEFITDEVLKDYKKIVLELSPGSLALFHPFVIHGSAPNNSQTPRRVLINGYTVPGVNSFEYPGCGTGKSILLT